MTNQQMLNKILFYFILLPILATFAIFAIPALFGGN